eukprot:4138792-Karenia_brevis.AAC.1
MPSDISPSDGQHESKGLDDQPDGTMCEPCKPGPCHDEYTHVLMDPTCEFCRAGKIQRSQCRRSDKEGHCKPDPLPKPQQFGDSVTGDHQNLCAHEHSRH